MPDALVEFLRDKSLLLILDNYESVDSEDKAAARYLSRLVSAAHGLRLLVTGRSAPKIQGVEQIVPT